MLEKSLPKNQKKMPRKKNLNKIDLYFITDSKLTKKSVLDDVKAAIKADVKIIQYREKEKCTKDMIEEAKKIKEICGKSDVIFLIDDRVDVALAVNADGVHLGTGDMPYNTARKLLREKIIGLTIHNVEEAIEAEKLGADYVGVSPVFETKTKLDAGPAAGLQLIKDVKGKIRIPFVAIGGINLENLKSVLEAGAKSVVAISAIVTKDDVEEECKKFMSIIKNHQ